MNLFNIKLFQFSVTLLNSNGAPVNSIAVETSPNACIIEKTMLAVLQSGKKAYISSASSNACNFPVGEYKIDSVLRSVGMPLQILLTHVNGTAIENFPSDTSSSNCLFISQYYWLVNKLYLYR